QHLPLVVITGQPNVGKSVLFHRLTGRYVTVSNYPGTTVEITRGVMRHNGRSFIVIDSPGLYSLNPITEEERVARRILLHEHPDLVLHVVDAKNLPRMLPLTLQMIEMSLPTILVLNMMDELERAGLQISIEALRQQLAIPVVPTVCLTGQGIPELKELIDEQLTHRDRSAIVSSSD
ncbi:MAG: 50S ribosome-binding GTPase, partial [Fimbriimonadales bacterium]|nr:50S ribosome-binding GTPase [Fimbriimonadales bacterium]